MAQIFISYSRKDLSFVKKLATDLAHSGLDVWYDLSDLHGGSRWSKEIESAIRESKYVLILLSPESVSSKWVEEEFLFASKLNKKIIPLLLKKCELPFGYHALQAIDIQGVNYKKNFREILHSLGENLGTPIPPKQPTQWRTWSFGGAVLLMALIIGWLLSDGWGPGTPTKTPTFTSPRSTLTPQPTGTPSPIQPVTVSPTSPQVPSETPTLLLAPIAGEWVGIEKTSVDGKPVAEREAEISIKADCNIGDNCGERSTNVNGDLCIGNLFLVTVEGEKFTFQSVAKVGTATFCGEGGTFILQLVQNDTLASTGEGSNSSGKRIIKTGIYSHP